MLRRTHCEHMSSAYPSNSDIARRGPRVSNGQQLTCHAQSKWSIAVNCPARVYRQRHLKDGADAHRWLRLYSLTNETGHQRLFSATGTIRRAARDYQYELGPDRLFEPVAVPDCHHKRIRLGWVRTHAVRPRTARPDDVLRSPARKQSCGLLWRTLCLGRKPVGRTGPRRDY